MGLTTENDLPTAWGGPAAEHVLWKSPLPVHQVKGKPDHNQSSPIIVAGKAIVTTSFWPVGRESNEFPEHHVTCYSLNNGEQLWDTQIPPGPWKLSDLRGGYTAPTPASDGQRICVLFGSSVLATLDLDGQIKWRVEVPEFQSFDVAIAVSPIIFQDRILLVADRSNKKGTLNAYSLSDGKLLWEVSRAEMNWAHSTPVITEIGGQLQMLVAASNALQGLNPSTGKILWFCKTSGDVCSPVTDHQLVYLDSGRGGSGIAVEPPADLTGQTPVEIPADKIKWKISQVSESMASPVIFGNQLYRLQGQGVLRSFDLTTGKERYATRLEGVSSPSSPIVTPSGLIYLASAGKSYVVRAGEKYDLVGTNELGDPCAASPAVAAGKLILKGQQYVFCI
ncbi:MAG: outer rane biosis protein BamB, partial [Planctomycetaceae bacterium]|nr:outer rane biosis protein BamB [Planctomycetaceae bacterium]